jgi:hypothetical protein
MRLLKLEDDGEFSLTEFFGDGIPPYAALSHTWGPPMDEVTFKDVTEGAKKNKPSYGGNKPGYEKIRFCQKQAAADGLEYFWVDTCCIDKRSSAELSEAINSMYRWYHNAAKCYVYLSDVRICNSSQLTIPSQPVWEPAFQKSRWFTRGWTLQELISPTSVEFFSVDAFTLGDRKSLGPLIHKITGIAENALHGALSDFSVDERLSWAANRKTTREEDAAYSLLGLFDVSMPLIYGEGRKKAFARLQKEIRESLDDSSSYDRDDRLRNATNVGSEATLMHIGND